MITIDGTYSNIYFVGNGAQINYICPAYSPADKIDFTISGNGWEIQLYRVLDAHLKVSLPMEDLISKMILKNIDSEFSGDITQHYRYASLLMEITVVASKAADSLTCRFFAALGGLPSFSKDLAAFDTKYTGRIGIMNSSRTNSIAAGSTQFINMLVNGNLFPGGLLSRTFKLRLKTTKTSGQTILTTIHVPVTITPTDFLTRNKITVIRVAVPVPSDASEMTCYFDEPGWKSESIVFTVELYQPVTTQFVFINRYGFYESVTFFGSVTADNKPKKTTINRKITGYDASVHQSETVSIEIEKKFKVNTGYIATLRNWEMIAQLCNSWRVFWIVNGKAIAVNMEDDKTDTFNSDATQDEAVEAVSFSISDRYALTTYTDISTDPDEGLYLAGGVPA